MEGSGTWFFVEDSNGNERNLRCSDDTYDNATYSREGHLEPDYNCGNAYEGTWRWRETVQDNFNADLDVYHLRSMHSDCCYDGGDSSDLYRFEVWVR